MVLILIFPPNYPLIELLSCGKFFHLASGNLFQTTSIEEIAKKIADWEKVKKSTPRTVVITQGKDPAISVVGKLWWHGTVY